MRYLTIALVFVGLAACSGPKDETSTQAATPEVTQEMIDAETKRLNDWFEAKYEEQIQFSPLQLSFIGRKDRYDEVDDGSEEAADEQLEWQRLTVEEMQRDFDYEKLTPEAKLSYDIWKYQYENAAKGREFRNLAYTFTQMSGVQSIIPTFLMNFHKVDEESDMEAYISRISGVSRLMDQLLARAQKYAEDGVRPPRFAYEGVIDQSEKIITGAPFSDSEEDAPLWGDVKRKLGQLVAQEKIDQARADELQASARAALLENFQPSYQALIDWVTEDLPNTAEDPTGVSQLPNGEAYYNHRLAVSTTTDLTADEIHEIGLKEVARLRKDMEAIKEQVGFEGDLQEFFEFIRTDEQFFFPNTDDGRQGYIDAAQENLDFIKAKVPNYFGILPKADLVVKRVEPFREQDGAAQHYFPGTPDGSRPGIYYAHLSDMTAMPKNQIEVIAYHEGLPGHHMQISIAQELESVPTFRTQAGFGAYIEGWGLYSEYLAKEMGAYQDPYSDFGRLTTEIWRAIRLVVDTGLHAKGWTESEAIQYFMDNSPEPLESVTAEVQRYLVIPGQATSYKIGMLKIQELRDYAERELGDKFDIRAFHDTVLGGGAMPLALLERRVQAWVAQVKAS